MSKSTARFHRKPRNAREAALFVLTRVEQEGAYSNLLLNQTLNQAELSRADAGLATEIVYGTIQRRNTLDYWLAEFAAKGLDRLEPWVRNLLRLSLYQVAYLTKIPARAAVHEAVELAKRHGHQGIAGMVNGVLRNVLRKQQAGELAVPQALDPVRRIALEHSHPEWLVELWMREFGQAQTERIAAANNRPPRASARVNARKRSRDELLRLMRESGMEAAPSALSGAGIVVERGGNLAATPWYRDGELSIQDESSMLVAEAVDPKPGMKVLDCCAAPGGKTAHMAELMDDRGEVWANDLHEHKERLIATNAKRLGLACVHTLVGNAAELGQRFEPASFDRILLDAPCSGLGVIRRKPEIKWEKRPDDIEQIALLQAELLEAAHALLKPGGMLVYSTCTLARRENEDNVLAFLRKHADYAADAEWSRQTSARLGVSEAGAGMIQVLPQQHESDGFFLARMVKK